MAKDDEYEGETEEVEKLPSPEEISKLLKDHSLAAADMDEARGKIGAMIKNAEETRNVHRKAFKILTQVEKMDASKRSEFLLHLDHYLKIRGHAPEKGLFETAPADPPARKPSKVRRDAAALDRIETPVN